MSHSSHAGHQVLDDLLPQRRASTSPDSPQVYQRFVALGDAALPTALSRKVKELVALAIAVVQAMAASHHTPARPGRR